MIRIQVLPLLLVFVLLPPKVSSQVSDALVASLMDEYDVPGLSLSVVQGDSVSTYGWGYSDADQTVAITADTPFRIASVAKVFVAATVAVEVAAGTISFQDDVSHLIPHTGPYSGPITLHDLLTHTAGFDERLIGYGARSSEAMKPLGEYLKERMPERGWPVGEQISYSNHGMSLAGYAIEAVRGFSFAEAAWLNIFEPLEMYQTGFLTRDQHIPAGSATPLRCRDGACEVLPHYYSHAYPAGLAFSTARDMSRFITAMLEAGERETALAALIPERHTHDHRIPGMSYGFFNQYHREIRFLSHAGSVPGYWSLLMIAPDAGIGFFFVANGGASGFGERLRDVVLHGLFGEEAARPPRPVVSEEITLREGVYESTRYSHNTIERFPQAFRNSIEVVADADTLMVFSGGRLRQYVQVGDDLYENLDGSDRIAFGERRGEIRLFRTSFVYGAGLPEAYEKRPWYHAPGFLNEYVSWLLGIPILVLFILWPVNVGIDLFLRRRRGQRKRPAVLKQQLVWGLTAMAAALFTAFGFGFVAQSNRKLESGALFFDMPQSMLALTWIPPFHAFLVVFLCGALVLVWKKAWWDVSRRCMLSLVLLTIVLQLIFLVQWNYLPISW